MEIFLGIFSFFIVMNGVVTVNTFMVIYYGYSLTLKDYMAFLRSEFMMNGGLNTVQ